MMFSDFKSIQSQIILFSLILASALGFFEGTAINIAVPAIQHQYSATVSQIQWVINSYQLILAVFMLISGSLGDIYGRKKILLAGLMVFTLGSMLCGIASDINWLIGARVVQGLGAAFMIPQSLAIINSIYEKRIRGHAIGLWSGISGAMLIFGPFVSGLIVDSIGWQYIFHTIVPLGIITAFLVYKKVPDTKHEKQSIDWKGALLIGGSLSLISFVLIERADYIFMFIGILLFLVFVWWERQVENPLINLHVFKRRNIVLANIYTLFLYSIISAVSVFTVMYLQQLRNVSASTSGLMFMPLSVIITLMSLFSGSLADRFGARKPMIIGALLVSVGLFLFGQIQPDFNYWRDIFPGVSFMGLGFGLFIPALTKTALDVEDRYSGAASGVNYAVSRIASLFGVVILGALILSVFTTNLEKEMKSLNMNTSITKEIMQQKDKLLAIDIGNVPQLGEIAIRKKMNTSFIKAYRYQLWICAIMALLGAASAFFVREKKD